jgi:Rrf2 family protein
MKLSAQEEYGLRCMLAIAGSDLPLTIPEISEREGLSQSHAAKLLSILRRAELVSANRGPAGGYQLGKPAETIRVGEVLEALGGKLLEDDFCDRHTGHSGACSHRTGCAIHGLWSRLQLAIDQVVFSVTIQDLLMEPSSTPVNVSFGGKRPR